MGKKGKTAVLDTIWTIPDALWERLYPILEANHPTQATGRPRVNLRTVMDGIIFRMRSGCQWNQLPKTFGDDSTVHRYFQQWRKLGVFEQLWRVLVEECDDLKRVCWEWQAVDGMLGKARMGGDDIGPNPTDRAKNGTKKSLLVEEKGGP